MRKLVLFMHVSLDGFVAGINGEMDWINVNEEMFEVAGQQTKEADTALYGRATYQMMESYWPTAGDQPGASKHDVEHSAWYNKVQKVVLSKTMKDHHQTNTKIISENTGDEIRKLKQEAGKNILVFGSPTAVHSLLEENLIDEYWLIINPILLVDGIPLFKKIRGRINLTLVSSKVFASKVVCLHYVVDKHI
jgi:dihydrofolate reductase